jgi:hypothetical protein
MKCEELRGDASNYSKVKIWRESDGSLAFGCSNQFVARELSRIILPIFAEHSEIGLRPCSGVLKKDSEIVIIFSKKIDYDKKTKQLKIDCGNYQKTFADLFYNNDSINLIDDRYITLNLDLGQKKYAEIKMNIPTKINEGHLSEIFGSVLRGDLIYNISENSFKSCLGSCFSFADFKVCIEDNGAVGRLSMLNPCFGASDFSEQQLETFQERAKILGLKIDDTYNLSTKENKTVKTGYCIKVL